MTNWVLHIATAGRFNIRQSNFISPLVAALPFLEQGNNYQQWNFSKSYSDPVNQAVAAQRIESYLCPSMTLPREVPLNAAKEVGGPSSYLLCEGTDDYMTQGDGVFGLNWPGYGYNNPNRRFADITDGSSNTFFAGETVYDYTSEGTIQRWNAEQRKWEVVGQSADARFFHRLLPLADKQLVSVGGANMESGKFVDLEIISVP